MAASFSIREYTASTRGTASSRHPLLGAGDFPPMPARRFRWWADELPAPAAARSPPPRPRAPEKKRSVSDFCASASAADEASCAIKKRAKTVIKQQKKWGSQEDEDRIKAQLGRRSGEEDDDGEIFGSTPKANVVALNKFNPLDSAQTSMVTKREHIKIQNGKIHAVESRKLKKFKNLKKHKLKYIGGTKAINAQILGNSAKVLPLHNILKKYTKHSSVSMKEQKCSNSKWPEVIELCHKFVKHVTFSGVDDILSSNKQSSKLPQRLSLCKVFSDVLAASSSSTDNSDQADKFIAADSIAHKNKETSFEVGQSVRNISDGGSSVSSRTKLPPGLIDLNRAPPDSADFNYPSISDSELPNLEHAKNATCDSDFQILGDGRETVLKHNQNLPFNSQPVQCELSIYDSGRIINSKSVVTLLPREASNISHTEMVSLPLNSRGEFTKFFADCQRSSVRDSKMKGKVPYAFPHHTVEYSIQHPQNWYTNLNQGNFHPTGGEFCCYQSLNPPHSEKPRFHSDMNVQPGHAAVVGHTVRLMGKDLTVSSSRSKCIGETAKEHADPSIRCHHTTKMFLELPREGRPFLSLQSQSCSNTSADAPSTSQAYVGYRLHHVRHRFPEAGVFSGIGKECGDRFRNFSYLHHGRNAPSRFPPHPDHGSRRSNQNLLAPCYSDLISTPEPQMTTFFPTFVSHMTRSSVYHANSTRPCYPYSAIVHPHDGMNFTYALKQSDQITREVAEVTSDVDILSRNTGRKTTRTDVGNSSISSGARYMPRSGPVKLSAGAKHVLELSRNTDDDNPPPVYSCLPFVIISRDGNISSGQNKVAESCK